MRVVTTGSSCKHVNTNIARSHPPSSLCGLCSGDGSGILCINFKNFEKTVCLFGYVDMGCATVIVNRQDCHHRACCFVHAIERSFFPRQHPIGISKSYLGLALFTYIPSRSATPFISRKRYRYHLFYGKMSYVFHGFESL